MTTPKGDVSADGGDVHEKLLRVKEDLVHVGRFGSDAFYKQPRAPLLSRRDTPFSRSGASINSSASRRRTRPSNVAKRSSRGTFLGTNDENVSMLEGGRHGRLYWLDGASGTAGSVSRQNGVPMLKTWVKGLDSAVVIRGGESRDELLVLEKVDKTTRGRQGQSSSNVNPCGRLRRFSLEQGTCTSLLCRLVDPVSFDISLRDGAVFVLERDAMSECEDLQVIQLKGDATRGALPGPNPHLRRQQRIVCAQVARSCVDICVMEDARLALLHRSGLLQVWSPYSQGFDIELRTGVSKVLTGGLGKIPDEFKFKAHESGTQLIVCGTKAGSAAGVTNDANSGNGGSNGVSACVVWTFQNMDAEAQLLGTGEELVAFSGPFCAQREFVQCSGLAVLQRRPGEWPLCITVDKHGKLVPCVLQPRNCRGMTLKLSDIGEKKDDGDSAANISNISDDPIPKPVSTPLPASFPIHEKHVMINSTVVRVVPRVVSRYWRARKSQSGTNMDLLQNQKSKSMTSTVVIESTGTITVRNNARFTFSPYVCGVMSTDEEICTIAGLEKTICKAMQAKRDCAFVAFGAEDTQKTTTIRTLLLRATKMLLASLVVIQVEVNCLVQLEAQQRFPSTNITKKRQGRVPGSKEQPNKEASPVEWSTQVAKVDTIHDVIILLTACKGAALSIVTLQSGNGESLLSFIDPSSKPVHQAIERTIRTASGQSAVEANAENTETTQMLIAAEEAFTTIFDGTKNITLLACVDQDDDADTVISTLSHANLANLVPSSSSSNDKSNNNSNSSNSSSSSSSSSSSNNNNNNKKKDLEEKDEIIGRFVTVPVRPRAPRVPDPFDKDNLNKTPQRTAVDEAADVVADIAAGTAVGTAVGAAADVASGQPLRTLSVQDTDWCEEVLLRSVTHGTNSTCECSSGTHRRQRSSVGSVNSALVLTPRAIQVARFIFNKHDVSKQGVLNGPELERLVSNSLLKPAFYYDKVAETVIAKAMRMGGWRLFYTDFLRMFQRMCVEDPSMVLQIVKRAGFHLNLHQDDDKNKHQGRQRTRHIIAPASPWKKDIKELEIAHPTHPFWSFVRVQGLEGLHTAFP